MANTPDLSNAGLLDDDEIPQDSLLGHLVGVIHHQFVIPAETLDPIINASGLPEEYRPNRPSATRAFQRACRGLETPKYQEVLFRDPGSDVDIKFGVEFMVDVLKDGSRQLTRKIHFIGNENASKALQDRLEIYAQTTQKEPEKMAKFEFDRKDESITVTELFKDADDLDIGAMTLAKAKKLQDTFDEIKDSYTERYLKTAWWNMARAEGGIPWLKDCGALWFIPKNAIRYVEAFGRMYRTIHNGTGTWRAVPVINTKRHRAYLREDVVEEYQSRYRTFLKNVAEKMDRGWKEEELKENISNYKADFEASLQKELVDRYNKLLGMSISAKVDDFNEKEVELVSDRLKKARDMLRNL